MLVVRCHRVSNSGCGARALSGPGRHLPHTAGLLYSPNGPSAKLRRTVGQWHRLAFSARSTLALLSTGTTRRCTIRALIGVALYRQFPRAKTGPCRPAGALGRVYRGGRRREPTVRQEQPCTTSFTKRTASNLLHTGVRLVCAKHRRAQGDVCLANYYRPSLLSGVKLQGGPGSILGGTPSMAKPSRADRR